MYKETITTADNSPNIPVIICNSCNHEFSSIDPHYSDKKYDYHLCTNCIEQTAEEYISSFKFNGLLWIESIKNKFFKKYLKKRNTYLPKELRKEILKKYKFTCQYCGSKDNLTIDHIKPVSRGGTDSPTNLTILCRSCNSRKGAKI